MSPNVTTFTRDTTGTNIFFLHILLQLERCAMTGLTFSKKKNDVIVDQATDIATPWLLFRDRRFKVRQ